MSQMRGASVPPHVSPAPLSTPPTPPRLMPELLSVSKEQQARNAEAKERKTAVKPRLPPCLALERL